VKLITTKHALLTMVDRPELHNFWSRPSAESNRRFLLVGEEDSVPGDD
jgi:hypothetical protein